MRHDKDVYTIEAYSDDFLRLLEVAEEARVRIEAQFLPAPLDVLINEYNMKHCKGKMEYRDIFADERHMNENFKLIKSYLKRIDVVESTLVIIDAYIFPNNYDNSYRDDLISLIEASDARQVIIVTSEQLNESLQCSISEGLKDLDIKLSIHKSGEFHDRFWLSIKTHMGFIMGTSLNGVGRKISCINSLGIADVRSIFLMLKELGIQ